MEWKFIKDELPKRNGLYLVTDGHSWYIKRIAAHHYSSYLKQERELIYNDKLVVLEYDSNDDGWTVDKEWSE